jgi:hypothetical protein
MAVQMQIAQVSSPVRSSKGDIWDFRNFALINEMKTTPSVPNAIYG